MGAVNRAVRENLERVLADEQRIASRGCARAELPGR
jgi:hypothetical protein